MIKGKVTKKCRLCDSINLEKFINFGNVPVGNNLLNTKKNHFPLINFL